VQRLKEAVIDPELGQLMTRYGNECLTGSLPGIGETRFVLGSTTIVRAHHPGQRESGQIDFLERQGILDPTVLGAVDPGPRLCDGRGSAVHRDFVRDYESFKKYQLADD